MVLSMQAVSAAPILPVASSPAGFGSPARFPFPSGSGPVIENGETPQESEPVDTALLSNEFLTSALPGGWFDAGGVELGISNENYALQIEPGSCLYPDSYFSSLGGGKDDCRVLTPGDDDSEIFSLPFLALSAWALVILLGAGWYHIYRNWRASRWLQHLRDRGLAPQIANRRSHAVRKSRRARSRTRSRRRSYAG